MSYTVVIADDEPLVLIGLQDMIDWAGEGFEIVGQARNGEALEKEIAQKQPDLVITDIKMPIKSGMEVLEELRKAQSGTAHVLPLFIFLTSFEEFDLIKQAMSLDAVDYIVKLEMDGEQLKQALSRARKKLDELAPHHDSGLINEKQFLQERYFMRQLFSIDTHELDASAVGIDLSYDAFAVACITLPEIVSGGTKANGVNLFYSAYRLIGETIDRYTKCYLTQLDLGHIAAILPFREKQKAGYRSYLNSAFRACLESLSGYFSLSAKIAVGPLVGSIDLISESFFKAKVLSSSIGKSETEPVFYDYSPQKAGGLPAIELDSEGFTRAFGELDGQLLAECIDKTIDSLRRPGVTRIQALDEAGSILYMATTLVPDAQDCLEEIFPSDENIFSYRQLYQALSTDEVIAWLVRLKEGFVRIFNERRQDYRMQTIARIQSYIRENVDKRLSLGSVASIFGYSQNYLSSLFSRYAHMSFVDYVNTAKIEKAKMLLADPNTMVYEVATMLGFESPFYFSKVFKKVTGQSPSQYQNSKKNKEKTDESSRTQ